MYSHNYSSIDEGESCKEDLIAYSEKAKHHASSIASPCGWAIMALLFFLTSLVSVFTIYMFSWYPQCPKHSSISSYESGWIATEISMLISISDLYADLITMTGVPSAAISIEEVEFFGTPHVYKYGTGYRLQQPDQRAYVGPPTPLLDQAWEELIGSK
jgi:hypothetical protein